MHIGTGKSTYEWNENWAKVPDSESATIGWAHHGIVVTQAQDVITFHSGEPTVMIYDEAGNLQRQWDIYLSDGHEISLVKERGAEYLWFADPGAKRDPKTGYEYPPGARRPQVVKTDLDGRTMMSLEIPPVTIYSEDDYSPTSVAVNEERFGGNGDIWVSDGYGQF